MYCKRISCVNIMYIFCISIINRQMITVKRKAYNRDLPGEDCFEIVLVVSVESVLQHGLFLNSSGDREDMSRQRQG